MTVLSFGYATAQGMRVLGDDGRKLTVKSKRFGNMWGPDPEDFKEVVLEMLKSDDVVLTPSGPNDVYIAGCAVHSEVLWMHPGTLATLVETAPNGNTPEVLQSLFKTHRDRFYTFQPADKRIVALRLMVQNAIGTERSAVKAGNELSQALRREQSYFNIFGDQEKAAWKKRFIATEKRKHRARCRKMGFELTKKQDTALTSTLTALADKRFEAFFEGNSDKERQEIVAERLSWFGVDELRDHEWSEVKKFLKTMPENEIFDGLISSGTLRVRAQVLAYMRNPLLYPNVRALMSYAGVSNVENGQAAQRRHGTTNSWYPNFRRVLCFDFGEKYWQNDTVGLFQALYYAYKRHQTLLYWPLIQLTAQVFKVLGKKAEDADIRDDDDDEVSLESLPKNELVLQITEKMNGLSHLPMIAKNPAIQEEIDSLLIDPDPNRLWRLFVRGNVTIKGEKLRGFNLQMPPKRIERRAKRIIGATLVKAVYYRWLAMMEAPLPFEEDFIYLKQWRSALAIEDKKALPEEFQVEDVIGYYNMAADEIEESGDLNLPLDRLFRLTIPAEREKWFKALSVENRIECLLNLTKADQVKWAEKVLPAAKAKALLDGTHADEQKAKKKAKTKTKTKVA